MQCKRSRGLAAFTDTAPDVPRRRRTGSCSVEIFGYFAERFEDGRGRVSERVKIRTLTHEGHRASIRIAGRHRLSAPNRDARKRTLHFLTPVPSPPRCERMPTQRRRTVRPMVLVVAKVQPNGFPVRRLGPDSLPPWHLADPRQCGLSLIQLVVGIAPPERGNVVRHSRRSSQVYSYVDRGEQIAA